MSQHFRTTGTFVLWTVVFSLVYCQAPLYYSNQNQYFLHGLADGGYGYLSSDWQAQTADATPVFSFLVQATYRLAHPAVYYVYYASFKAPISRACRDICLSRRQQLTPDCCCAFKFSSC